MPEATIVATGLTHRYGAGSTASRALDRVSLVFHAGILHLVMGPSGSGKTTLLSILGCILSPEEGEIRVLGQSVTELLEEERAALRRRHVGLVFQSFRLFRALSALETVLVALEVGGVRGAAARARARDALESVGLADKAERRPHELSGGEKQRLAIARALVAEPEIVLADEPTAALDAASGQQVAEILQGIALNRGRLVIVVSHDPRLISYAERTVVLDYGRVIEDRYNPGAGGRA